MKSMSEAGLRQAGRSAAFAPEGPRLRLGAQRLALEERPRAVLHRRAVGRRASCAAGRASGPAMSAASEVGTEPSVAQADSRRGRASHRPVRAAPRSVRRVRRHRRSWPRAVSRPRGETARGHRAPGGRQEPAKMAGPAPSNPRKPAKMAGPGPRGSRKPAKMAGIGVRIDELARRCPCTTAAPEPPEGRAEEQVDLERGRRSGGRPVRRAWRIPGGLGFVACFQRGRAVGGRMPSRTRNRQRRSFKHEVKRRTGGRRGPEPNS